MFVLNLIRWFVGYVVFTVEGNGQERFVKFVCPFWIYDLECKKKGIFFCLYFTDKI